MRFRAQHGGRKRGDRATSAVNDGDKLYPATAVGSQRRDPICLFLSPPRLKTAGSWRFETKEQLEYAGELVGGNRKGMGGMGRLRHLSWVLSKSIISKSCFR